MLTKLSLFVSSALAQQALPPGAPPGEPSFMQLLSAMAPMLLVVFLVFHFMVLRPQSLKLKAQENLLVGLKKGDNVTTSSGIIGRVAGIEKEYILLEVAPNVRIRVERNHISKAVEKPGAEKTAA